MSRDTDLLVSLGLAELVPKVARLDLTRLFDRLYRASDDLNRRNIQELIGPGPYASLCDLGCDDGSWTAEIASSSNAANVVGVDIVPGRARLARDKGINVVIADLAHGLPFRNDAFDLVHANQVIEHVSDIDEFLREIFRVLRPNGVAVISTENGSSWHNISAAIMGWQMFSLTNISSTRLGVGNPFALHRGESHEISSLKHRTILNYLGLIELLGCHGLKIVGVIGSGYHPFPARFGRIDSRHAHFISVKTIKVVRD